MSASLVGSEMCIRDRYSNVGRVAASRVAASRCEACPQASALCSAHQMACLLYTSDAADDM
eukprot:11417609-Alexandrium_andersonii.AAC.1